jgi:hypothetical protein
MKPSTLIGIVLIVVGIIGFAVGGFSYSHEKQDAKIGPSRSSTSKPTPSPSRQSSAASRWSEASLWS